MTCFVNQLYFCIATNYWTLCSSKNNSLSLFTWQIMDSSKIYFNFQGGKEDLFELTFKVICLCLSHDLVTWALEPTPVQSLPYSAALLNVMILLMVCLVFLLCFPVALLIICLFCYFSWYSLFISSFHTLHNKCLHLHLPPLQALDRDKYSETI